jgi:hypothetical protein
MNGSSENTAFQQNCAHVFGTVTRDVGALDATRLWLLHIGASPATTNAGAVMTAKNVFCASLVAQLPLMSCTQLPPTLQWDTEILHYVKVSANVLKAYDDLN